MYHLLKIYGALYLYTEIYDLGIIIIVGDTLIINVSIFQFLDNGVI